MKKYEQIFISRYFDGMTDQRENFYSTIRKHGAEGFRTINFQTNSINFQAGQAIIYLFALMEREIPDQIVATEQTADDEFNLPLGR